MITRKHPFFRSGTGALVCTTLLLAACGRSPLLDFGGVNPPCDGPGCVAPPDLFGCVGLARFPDMGCTGPDCDMACSGPGCPPRPDGGGDGPCAERVEVCDNKIDDNCNDLVDCKDPQCAADSHCVKPGQEICNNGLDDDNNGLVDCLDPVCVNFPGCEQHMCDVQKPNCADPACVNEPACQNLVCKPTVDFGTLPQYDGFSEKMVTTVNTKDVAITPCAPGGGGMVVTQVDIATDDTVVTLAYTQGPNSDHVFGLFRAGVNQDCAANPIGCYDPKSAAMGTKSLALPKGRYYLIVQAFTLQHQGDVDVTLTTTSSKKKEICNNGVDDDGNGLIDCADPVCANDNACANKICKPDVNVGTLVVGDPPKLASFDTSGSQDRYSFSCGAMGKDYAVQFRLAQAADLYMPDFTEGNFSDHQIDLFYLPPVGQKCDAKEVQGNCLPVDPGGRQTYHIKIDWGEFPAGDYLFVFKALKPGLEGPVDIQIQALAPHKIELCHNGIDDDNNGLTDCADPACINDQGCGPPVCMPSVDFGLLKIGDSQTARLDLTNGIPALTATCARGGGRSRVIQFTLDHMAGLDVDCNSSPMMDYVVDLFYVAGPRDSCDKNEVSCADPGIIPFGCNYEWPGIQPGNYYLILQAFQPGMEGAARLTLSAVDYRALEICNNGVDDDNDGFKDCADKKCATSPYCAAKACKADQTIDPMPIDGSAVMRNVDTSNKQVTAQPPCEVKPGGGNAVVYVNMPDKANLTVNYLQGFGSNNHVMALYPVIGNGLVCEAAQALDCQPTNGTKQGSLTFKNVAGGPYWLVIAADKPGDEGPVFLELTASP